jgi:hypothetical protein
MLSTDVLRTGINGWLTRESAQADRSLNKYLSDYQEAMIGYRLPPGEPHNLSSAKIRAHTSRLHVTHPFWLSFAEFPESDFASGRLLFTTFMLLSGNRRRASYLEATSQTEYNMLRTLRAPLPNDYFDAGLSRLGQGVPTLDDLRDLADAAISSTPALEAAIHDAVLRDSPRDALEENERLGRDITELAIGIIAFAGAMRSGIESVPVLEPRSITLDPAVIYPFVDGFWQHYTPSPVPSM